MEMPGFTAEVTLCRTGRHWNALASPSDRSSVSPAGGYIDCSFAPCQCSKPIRYGHEITHGWELLCWKPCDIVVTDAAGKEVKRARINQRCYPFSLPTWR